MVTPSQEVHILCCAAVTLIAASENEQCNVLSISCNGLTAAAAQLSVGVIHIYINHPY